MTKKRIGVLTGGGDVPGLNAAIKAVVHKALDEDYEVIGIRRGWGGLLWYDFDDPTTHDKYIRILSKDSVRRVDRTGGTFLHTSRTNPQKVKAGDVPEHLKGSPLGKQISPDGTMDFTGHALKVIARLGIDSLISIGGDDTLSYSVRLQKEGFPVVAIPKTMDNDVFGTDYCIGFSTAVSRTVAMITDLRTSIGSHERIGVFELFGRNSGETSLVSSYLSYVDRAIISEVPFNMEKLANFLAEDKRNNPAGYSIVTISEGAYSEGGSIVETGPEDAYGHRKLGGIGDLVSEKIKYFTGENTMFIKFSYLMRCGVPDSLDRMVATAFGSLAMQLTAAGDFGKMVALQDGKYTTVPLEYVLSGKKFVNVDAFYDKETYKPKIKNFMGLPAFLA
ncbi:MAG: 6-phosphofructokinase [Anaerolineaceae bacterium]|nr:6-phosphofructokinase [Anaerolineaceae bacterium]